MILTLYTNLILVACGWSSYNFSLVISKISECQTLRPSLSFNCASSIAKQQYIANCTFIKIIHYLATIKLCMFEYQYVLVNNNMSNYGFRINISSVFSTLYPILQPPPLSRQHISGHFFQFQQQSSYQNIPYHFASRFPSI